MTKIQTVKAVRKGIRDTPKAFEIFTGEQTYRFKAKGHQNVEQWVQCLHIAVARSHNAGSAPPSVHSVFSVSGVSFGANGAAAIGGTRRSSRRSSGRAATYSGLFEPPVSPSVAGNPPASNVAVVPPVSSNVAVVQPVSSNMAVNPPASSNVPMNSLASRRVVMDTKL